jgi:hypothetical protein
MNVQMAEPVADFRENRPRLDPPSEGALLVSREKRCQFIFLLEK